MRVEMLYMGIVPRIALSCASGDLGNARRGSIKKMEKLKQAI